MTKEPKPTRQVKKREFSALQDALNHFKLSDTEAAVALGYSDNVIHAWRHLGTVPAVAVLAAEGLVRRANGGYKPPTENPAVIVALVTGQKKSLLETFLKGLDISWQEIV